ncbi:MAG: hypothetical protein COX44_00405 [Candidatus Portnoybacteria bacterium CG23_combo_of_CG06-09_8_20_14_all_37_13]|uniref:Dephospho-CoA kinase n=1 Tax=Candidatus Portnoybacteria bacterium CG23_combo_of_CG06-09_8_20_14_all_37_13 TaxID=1974819 RepID=A0A2G9YDN1_9BACT|nr:MAG: hypothetical protein COX44_00405 [Candidatus Portnoybacteria bacterium CG23_combo_of_CG06-09_8_20_14_all_37_13]
MLNRKKIILGIIGEIAAGKTTISDYLKKQYKATSFRFSDMLRDILNRLYLQKTRENMQKLSTLLRQNFGEDIMSKTILHDVQNAKSKFIITEGIRRPSDTLYLKELSNFYLIAINTKMRLRYERLIKRNENIGDKNKTWQEFRKESKQEAEQKIRKITKQADFIIDNNGSLKQLYKQINEIINKIE